MTKILQNFFKTTVSIAWGTGTGNLYLATKPTSNTAGWLVVSPNSASLREIVAYSGTGTDGSGDYIVCTARGVGGTTAQVHAVAEPVRMNITAEHWADIFASPTFTGTVTVPTPTNSTDAASKGYADALAIAGSPDATTSTKGIVKMSVAPVSATSPIAVGDNDPRVPTVAQLTQLVPTGAMSPFAGITTPTNWLLADGTAYSRATYASLFAVLNPSLGTATMTLANPAVITKTAHGLAVGDSIYFTTTGTLPAIALPTVNVLAVGGGRGGQVGSNPQTSGAGGNAGQVVNNTATTISVGANTVTVGDGGAANGGAGTNSVFSTVTATEGGGATGGAYGGTGGVGGAGTANSITGASVVYAGAGGGALNGAGGSGGGGNGGGSGSGSCGAAATAGSFYGAGGGGGGYYNGGGCNGAAGSAGVVIISYPTGMITATGGTITTNEVNTVHTFTTTGTFTVTQVNLLANTIYRILTAGLTADDFEIGFTDGGVAISTLGGSQSGTHTLWRSLYGIGDGSTTFNVPNLKNRVPIGRDSATATINYIGEETAMTSGSGTSPYGVAMNYIIKT